MGLFDYRWLSLIGITKIPKTPWRKYYNSKIMKLDLKDENIYKYLLKRIKKNKCYDSVAFEYYGTKITYEELVEKIDSCADNFLSLGIKKFDIITIISANIPEAIISFYALNKIGAVCNMLHPLLSQNEIKNILNQYETKYVITIDTIVNKIDKIIKKTHVKKVIVVSPANSMSLFTKIGYKIFNRDKEEIINTDRDIKWKEFTKLKNKNKKFVNVVKKDDPAVIFQSGGTTGTPKGIVLSNGNINASTTATLNALTDLKKGDKLLGIMPIFHGYGLEVSINDALCIGATIVLIPQFKANEIHKLIKKYDPNILVGVPTLFEAITMDPNMDKIDLSHLKYVISGGDSLNRERIEKINSFLYDHGSNVSVIQGYGLTEAVAVNCVDIRDFTHPGTVGIPLPGIYMGIFAPGTDQEVDYGEDGEICICGPTVMLGYYENEAETNLVLQHHRDGNIWLHTGDIGSMNKNGFITYKQRSKRMIISSGYNVYPAQIEEVLEEHEAIDAVSVIGIPHKYKIEVPKAFVVLKKGYRLNQALKDDLIKHCKKNLAIYAVPKEYVALDKLPKTVVGKVDFNKLREKSLKEMERKNGKN